MLTAAAYRMSINITVGAFLSGWFYPDFSAKTVVEKVSKQLKTNSNRNEL